MKFKYRVDLKKGYRPAMQIDEETEVSFVLEAPNRATADRAVAALLRDAPNVKELSGACIED